MAPKCRSAGATDSGRKLHVAWIADPKKFGKKPGYPKPSVRDRLQREAGWSYVRLTPEEVRQGALQQGAHDIFLVPGGYAPNFAEALGERGGARIREFVQAGGGYFGICAGAYLGSMWGFELLPVDILDINHWDRGKTDACELRATPAGRRVAGTALPDHFAVRYANGPLFEILDGSVDSFIEFESQLRGKRGTYPPLMRGSPAAVAGTCGRGRVVLLSPHMEGTPAVADAFRSFVRWTAGEEVPPPPPAPVPSSRSSSSASRVRTRNSRQGVVAGRSRAAHPTEAEIVELFRQASSADDGWLTTDELAALLTQLDESLTCDGSVEELIDIVDLNRNGKVQYEEFVAWMFGTPGIFDSAGDRETDGEEDATMDVPSLVRMRSVAQYQSVNAKQEEGALDGDAVPPPAPPLRLELARSCSDGCSGHTRIVTPNEVERSAVTIQRAARARQEVLGSAPGSESLPSASSRAKAKTPSPAAEALGSGRRGDSAEPQASSSSVPKAKGKAPPSSRRSGSPPAKAKAAPSGPSRRPSDSSAKAKASPSGSNGNSESPPVPAKRPQAPPSASSEPTPKAKAKVAPSGPLLRRDGLDYVCSLQGPILITAPHSMKLVRGGGDTAQRTRNHKRERWTAEIAVTVARELQQHGHAPSFIIWNRMAGPGHGRLDPNYLVQKQFAASPWHRALHRWALSTGCGGPASGDDSVPLLHVDVHGKVSEKLHLDLGAAPLEVVWPQQDQHFVRAFKAGFCRKLDKAMADCGVLSAKGKQIAVDLDPALHGFWGEDTVTTISHQSVLLGIPAVQFEMPPRLREQLVMDPRLGQLFAAAIAGVYRDVVVPWWRTRCASLTPWPRLLPLEPTLATQVEELSLGSDSEEWAEKLLGELLGIERASTEIQI